MKRDYISEIQTLKVRSNPVYSKFLWNNRLATLRNSYQTIIEHKADNELLKYIPIAIVACFEAFLKAFVADLIDIGEPYSKNVGKLNQSREIKFDFEVVNAIQNKKLSVGEFIAHFLPCKRISDIDANLSVLIGQELLTKIQGFEGKTLHREDAELFSRFNKNPNLIFKSVNRTFELRHIFCHEFADNVIIDESEILECLNHSELFLNQISSYLQHLIDPNFPQNQAEINMQSAEDFQKRDQELLQLTDEIIKNNSDNNSFDKGLFDETLTIWRQFRESKALLDSNDCKGGSIYNCLITGSKRLTTERFIEELKQNFQIS